MTFRGSYLPDFHDQAFVEEVISKWNTGAKSFTLKTSGSTGPPRDIELDRKLLVWSSEQTKKRLKLNEEHVFCCLPVQKTGGFMQVIRALYFGWDIAFAPPSLNPLQDVDPSLYTVISLTPTQLQHILEECPDKLIGFRNVILGGAHVFNDLIELIDGFNAKHPKVTIWESYGMTETASHVALKNLSTKELYFTPNDDVEITSIKGQLGIRIQPFDFYYETTDLAVITNNKFKILGRMDDVINSAGVKIHPTEIEPKIRDILAGLRIFRKLYLTKRNDHELGEKAVLVLEGEPIQDHEFILELLKRELPPYQSPKELHFVENIVYTNTGKVMRKAVD